MTQLTVCTTQFTGRYVLGVARDHKEIQMSKTVYIVWIGVQPVAKYLDVKAALERAHEIWNDRDGRSPFSSVFVEITEED